jgi:hypothetical protein
VGAAATGGRSSWEPRDRDVSIALAPDPVPPRLTGSILGAKRYGVSGVLSQEKYRRTIVAHSITTIKPKKSPFFMDLPSVRHLWKPDD